MMPFILSRTQAKISSGFKTVSVYTNFFSPHHKNKPPPAILRNRARTRHGPFATGGGILHLQEISTMAADAHRRS
jgi:hypothetical protein